MSASEERIDFIFDAALEQEDPTLRAAYIRQACAGDEALRLEVEDLLRAHEEAGTFLQGVAPGAPWGAAEALDPALESKEEKGPTLEARALVEKQGDRIGRYKLVERIGEGGFGDVWMAEQEEPVRRRVALKIIKLGMDTKQVICRFENERQALALMDHPNIAKVFDGGATETGRPYFVMELVEGTRITEYCDQHQLSMPARLQLFIRVCQAVQHAHQKGIIHRDLKPSNVLVTVQNGLPVPKVIDFGIAKVTDDRTRDPTLLTRHVQFIGTPAYISPEQAAITGVDLDTRSDIYSLGVLLYELLVGQLPFRKEELLNAGFDKMRHTILEKQPPLPSTRLRTTQQATLIDTALRRQTDPPRLIRQLRGDLDWIIMKCLEKDRNRRYSTANGLAMDLQRYLRDEPVWARPPSPFYVLQKAVRRNKVLFATAAVLLPMLALSLATSTLLLMQEIKAHRRALAAENKAEERLRDALLAQARAERFSGRPSRRSSGLDAVAQAANMPLSMEAPSRLALRHEAIALLTLAEVHLGRRLTLQSAGNPVGAVHPGYLLYAHGDPSGNVLLRRFEDDGLVSSLPGGGGFRPVFLQFSSEGRYLAGKFDHPERTGEHLVQVWEWAQPRRVLSLTNVLASPGVAFAFHPLRPELAVGRADGTLAFFDLASGKLARTRVGPPRSYYLSYSPDGRFLAVSRCNHPEVQLLSLLEETGPRTLLHSGGVYGLAWHPSGTQLAVAGDDRHVYLWDLPAGRLRAPLHGHRAQVVRVAFSPNGELLASSGWDSTVCIWDWQDETLLVRAPAKLAYLRFDASGTRLGLAIQDRALHLLEMVANRVSRSLHCQSKSTIHAGAFSPDGRLFAMGTEGGLILWDLSRRMPLGRLDSPATYGMVQFTADGQNLVVSRPDAVECWPIHGHAELPSHLQFGPLKTLGFPEDTQRFCFLPGTRQIVGACSTGFQILDLDRGTPLRSASGHPRARNISVSPDGKWIATGTWDRANVVIWDAASGQQTAVLPLGSNTRVLFCPDGRCLVTAEHGLYSLWETGSWTRRHQFTNDPGRGSVEMDFSPDGRLLAVRKSAEEIQLLDPATGQELARLPGREVWPLCFSPDGSLLAVAESECQVHLWDLRLLRQELAQMNLDWDLPPYPPAKKSTPPAALSIEILANKEN